MNLHFNQSLATNYHSEPQKVRVLSEGWIEDNYTIL
ncbi:DpnI domain-containing protein [Psychrobacter proteolyticus]|nr:DpnI domain-containing protein [Psychrobacter proteolyticus]